MKTETEKEELQEAQEMRDRLNDVDLCYARNLASTVVDKLNELIAFTENESTDDMSYTVWEVHDLLNRVNSELEEL